MPTWLRCSECGGKYYTATSENHLEERHEYCDCGEKLEICPTDWGEESA